MDWFANDLPAEGSRPDEDRVGHHLDREPPMCAVDDTLSTAIERMDSAGRDECYVVDSSGVLLGRVRRDAVDDRDPDSRADGVMHEGPSTYRPSVAVRELAKRMDEHEITTVPVTTSRGRLLGLLDRDAIRSVVDRLSGG